MQEGRLLISQEQIDQKIASIAKEFNAFYQRREVTIIAILKGAVCFLVDLMRHLTFPFTLEFVTASSYGMRGMTPTEITLKGCEHLDLEQKEILLLDDIFDTGKTLDTVVKELKEKNPRGVKTAVLLRKKRTSKTTIVPDIVCFDIEDRFVVGYGLDYKEHFRGLKGIYTLDE